jgi:hypothetical protein
VTSAAHSADADAAADSADSIAAAEQGPALAAQIRSPRAQEKSSWARLAALATAAHRGAAQKITADPKPEIRMFCK